METIKINFKNIFSKDINLITEYLNCGKVIAYPSDTIYGLGCLATDKKAINKIYKIKRRDKKNPLLILVKSYCMLKKYCFVNKKQEQYLRNFWNLKEKRAISVILKEKGLLPKELTGGLDSIAVRIPSFGDLPKRDFLIKILKSTDIPLVSTSLNISGEDTLNKVDDIEKHFKKDCPDLRINCGVIKKTKPSKLIDLRDINNIKILRK